MYKEVVVARWLKRSFKKVLYFYSLITKVHLIQVHEMCFIPFCSIRNAYYLY